MCVYLYVYTCIYMTDLYHIHIYHVYDIFFNAQNTSDTISKSYSFFNIKLLFLT